MKRVELTIGGLLFGSLRAVLKRLPIQRLKRVPGAAFIHTAVYRRLKPHGDTEITCLGHRLRVKAHDEGVSRQLLVNGIYEVAESHFFMNWLQPGMTVVDVGANFGYFTVLAARAEGPGGVIHAFEPEPQNFALLQTNVAATGYSDRVQTHRMALGDAPGELLLFTDSANLGNHSLFKENVPDSAGALNVEVIALDAWLDRLPKVDLIKIDVQGFEARALRGAIRLLERDRPRILMEVWPEGLRRAGEAPSLFLEGLVERGYQLRPLGDDGRPAERIGVRELLAACDRRVNGDPFQNILFEPG